MVVILRVISGWFAALAAFVAFGWIVNQSTPHAIGWLALSVLLYVLSTIPPPYVP